MKVIEIDKFSLQIVRKILKTLTALSGILIILQATSNKLNISDVTIMHYLDIFTETYMGIFSVTWLFFILILMYDISLYFNKKVEYEGNLFHFSYIASIIILLIAILILLTR